MKYIDLDITNNAVATNSQITSKNVCNLRLKWFFKTRYVVTSNPIVRGDCLYFTDWGGNAYCVNKYTGELLWKLHIYSPPTYNPCLTQSDFYSVPYPWTGFAGSGLIVGKTWYLTSCGGRPGTPLNNGATSKLFAIDIKHAKVLYSNTISSSKWGCALADLLYFDGLLYVGICGVDQIAKKYALSNDLPFTPTTKGSVVAIKASTGMIAWTVDLTSLLPEDLPHATGLGIYSSFSLCPKTGMLYLATGSNYSRPPSVLNNSLVALNYKTGDFIWDFHPESDKLLPPSLFQKFSTVFTSGPQIFDYYQEEDRIPSIGIADYTGHYYIINRVTGCLLKKIKMSLGSVTTDNLPIILPLKANASISDGKILLGCNNGKMTTSSYYEDLRTMSVVCLDACSAMKLWAQTEEGSLLASSGVLCNDVYLIGNTNGHLTAYTATTGDLLNYLQVPGAHIASSLVADESSLYFGCGTFNNKKYPVRCGVYNYSLI